MGRFEKLNQDIRQLAEKILEDQDLCKLIYYPDNNPLDPSQPAVNGKREIMDKRLILYTPDLSLVKEVGTYVSIRVSGFIPKNRDIFLISTLVFEVYSHKESKTIYYYDKNGSDRKGDRCLLILDKIDEIMSKVDIGIGDEKLKGGGELPPKGDFFGYGIAYHNLDFRNQGR